MLRKAVVRMVCTSLMGVAALTSFSNASEEKSFSFYIFGDWGWNGYYGQRDVAQSMIALSDSIEPEFFVSLGDNFQVNGVRSVEDPLWQRNFESVYTHPVFEEDWYPVLGNHDYHGNPQAEIDYSKISRRWNMPARYHVVHKTGKDGATLDLFILDTPPLQDKYWKKPEEYPQLTQQDTARQLQWLDSALGASKADWKIVAGHHPIYSSGKHAAELVANPVRIGTILERHHVNAYFSGHDHHLEHLRAKKGTVDYFISGAGGVVRPTVQSAESQFVTSVPGFMVVTVSSASANVRVYSAGDSLLYSVPLKKIQKR